MAFRKVIGFSVFCVALAGMSTGASAQDDKAGEAEEEPRVALKTEAEIADGTCSTPRAAWVQHLLFSSQERYTAAAACFDTTGLTNAQAAALAERLFDHLNGENLFIDTQDPAADQPGYVDAKTGEAIYRAPVAPEFVIQRYEDGRWLFAPAALDSIPQFPWTKRLARMLPDWFQNKFIGIPVWKYFGVIVLLLIALVVQRFAVFVVRRYVKRIIGRTKLVYLDDIVSRSDRPIGGLSMATVLYLGFPLMVFPQRVSEIALIATKALAAFSVVWLGYRLIDVVGSWLARKASDTDTKMDDQLVPLVTKSLKVIVSILGGIFVLQNLNVNVGSLLAGVGLGGLAFALAAKDTVANFFGSVMIFIDKPFQIGDWVNVGGIEGTVEEVGFRTTRVRTFYNSLITMPNSKITNTSVDNYGLRKFRRYSTTLGLTYDTPPAKVQAFCEGVRAIIKAMPGMRKDFFLVEFKQFGPSSLDIMLYCFMVAETWNDEMRSRTELNLAIMRLADNLGVAFAFPTQTVHVDTLAASGKSNPSHYGPTETEQLVGVIENYEPSGEISAGYRSDE